MIASSKWQLLGYGPPGAGESAQAEDSPEWAVTFFEKTLFTPAGLDIYARTEQGLPDDLVGCISAHRDISEILTYIILDLLLGEKRR